MRTLLGSVAIAVLPALPACSSVDTLVTLAFTSPAAGSRHVRDTVEPADGWRAADVAVELVITGAPATIDLAAGDVALGTLSANGRGQALLIDAGATTLTATARDAAGTVVATATVDVEVVEPEFADCKAWLELYGIDYVMGPARQGVADPVTLTPPINGLQYHYVTDTAPRTTIFMDCSLARSLLEAAPHLRSRGVVEVVDMGVYDYRCIGGGIPPDCPDGLSRHAYGKALDIAGFTTGDGTFYSVNNDWVIDPTSEKTCEAATSSIKDEFLHDSICALGRHKVWNTVLTPNYNADHRDHFHVDLIPSSDVTFIGSRGGVAVDDGPDDH